VGSVADEEGQKRGWFARALCFGDDAPESVRACRERAVELVPLPPAEVAEGGKESSQLITEASFLDYCYLRERRFARMYVAFGADRAAERRPEVALGATGYVIYQSPPNIDKRHSQTACQCQAGTLRDGSDGGVQKAGGTLNTHAVSAVSGS
jgi:hypothetical protein